MAKAARLDTSAARLSGATVGRSHSIEHGARLEQRGGGRVDPLDASLCTQLDERVQWPARPWLQTAERSRELRWILARVVTGGYDSTRVQRR